MQTSIWENVFYSEDVNSSDIVYTPVHIVEQIITYLKPKGKILDPCRGAKAFYNLFPESEDIDYCEIREGKDFFNYSKNVDWIIGNPPYSIFRDWLKKSLEISDNVSYLLPTNKIFQSQFIMNMINEYGGIKSIMVFGSGNLIGFPFGFSVGNFHFEKGYKGETKLLMGMETIYNQTKNTQKYVKKDI